MGRREIAGAENKIILATIAVAGNETRGTFSTKEIALRAGVSEFTVFSHFHDKETLLDAADRYLYDRFYQNEIALAERYPKDFERFFNGLLDFFLADPSALRFIGTYSDLFPRQEDISDYEEFIHRFETHPPLSERYFVYKTTPFSYALTLYGLREVVTDALVLLTLISDTPALRHTMYLLYTKGANAFVKVA